MNTHCLRAALLLSALPALARAEAGPTHVDVFTSGTDGYSGYRIPAIEACPDGSLVALCEARKHNLADPGFGKQDIDLVCKRSTDNGRTWSKMQVVEDPGEFWSAANPATIVDRQTGRLWVLYLRSKPERSTRTSRPGTDDMQTLARFSEDCGVTWSDPIDLTAVARDMDDARWRASVVGPGGAIQTKSGRLIGPAWKAGGAEPPQPQGKPASDYGVFAIYSDDHGRTWQRGQILPGDNQGNENELVELADGRILADIRQTSGPHRWRATSSDGGNTWSEPCPGEAVSPVACAIERFTLKSAGDDRDRILWTGPKGPGRANLVVRISYDEGQTFPAQRPISSQHAAYSEMTILADKTVGVLWERGAERGYQFITFTRFGLDFLEPDRAVGQGDGAGAVFGNWHHQGFYPTPVTELLGWLSDTGGPEPEELLRVMDRRDSRLGHFNHGRGCTTAMTIEWKIGLLEQALSQGLPELRRATQQEAAP